MKVKCKGCGNPVERNTAFKIVIKGKNNYYCNENEYNNIKIEKESRIILLEIVKEIIGDTTNTILLKELKTISCIYSYKKILDYLVGNKQNLISIMNKSFNNEFSKIKYFSTIIKNNISDFIKVNHENEIKTNTNIEYTTIKYKAKSRKKSLSEYMTEYVEEEC